MELVITRTERETIYKFEQGESYDIVVIPTKSRRTNEKCAEIAWYSVFDGDRVKVKLERALARLRSLRKKHFRAMYQTDAYWAD